MARLVVDEVAKINATLPEATRVRRIVLLNKELDADDAEVTRTRKVRRAFVAEKYAPVIAALYDGAKETQLTMDITYEDGRKSQLTSTMLVHDIEPPGAAGPAAWPRERARDRCGCHPLAPTASRASRIALRGLPASIVCSIAGLGRLPGAGPSWDELRDDTRRSAKERLPCGMRWSSGSRSPSAGCRSG